MCEFSTFVGAVEGLLFDIEFQSLVDYVFFVLVAFDHDIDNALHPLKALNQ